MPNAQQDNLFVKGIKGNVAAKEEGFNTSDQSISNEVTTESSKSNTKHVKSHCRKKRSQKKTPINLSSEPTQVKFHPVKSEQLGRQERAKSKIVCNAQA